MRHREINIIHMFVSLLKYWWLIGILALLGASVAYINTSLNGVEIYRSTATIFIGKDDSISSKIGLTELKFNRSIINDYKELIETRYLLEKTKEELNLDITVDELRRIVFVQSIEGTRFMRIVAELDDANLASDIANSVAEELIESASQIVGIKNIQIVDYAKPGMRPVKPILSRDVMVGFIFGGMTAVYILLMLYALYDKVYDKESLELMTGSEVIGMIPKKKSNKVYDYIAAHLRFMIRNGNVVFFISNSDVKNRAKVVGKIALSACESGLKVLLIDCVQKQGVAYYQVHNRVEKYKRNHVYTTNKNNFDVVMTQDEANFLLNDFVEEVRFEYDLIVINSDSFNAQPKLLNAVDYFDHIINVSEHKQTKMEEIKDIIDILERLDKKITANVIYRSTS